MLYGHKEIVDNRTATLVSSADSMSEFTKFLELARNQNPTTRNFNEMFTSRVLEHLVEELYRGFRKPIHVFYHDNDEQREAFVAEWRIKILENGVQSRDKQDDMIHNDKVAAANAVVDAENRKEEAAKEKGEDYERPKEKTLGEMFGLDENDPWDRRSEPEKEEDEAMRKMAQQARDAGTMTGDSFFDTPSDKAKANPNPDVMPTNPDGNPADPNGQLKITDTDGIVNPDGSLNISKIRVQKTGGPVDENLKQAKEDAFEKARQDKLAGRTRFSPEDFARVLAGDGGSDAAGIKGDDAIRSGKVTPDMSGLSEDAQSARDSIKSAEQIAQERTKAENDFKAAQERDQGVFKGCALDGEDEVDVDDLPQEVQNQLTQAGHSDREVLSKDYPINSQLGYKSLIPFDGFGPLPHPGQTDFPQITNIAGLHNVAIDGTVSMGDANVAVVKRVDENQAGYIIIQRTGGRLGSTITVSVIKIR
jgi:hypothetical protein